jgi:Histidine kinase-, DNA gyrase B-, and HSP90-like ATPase
MKMETDNQCIEVIERTGNLYHVNVEEAWRKLTSRQFANEPARGLEEIISNAVDSYPDDTPKEQVKIDLDFTDDSIAVTDWGEGMPLNRIECLLTLGGSDKSFNDKKIGQFGVGFCSLFNPALGTRLVVVTTRCEDSFVEVIFTVNDPAKTPAISSRVLDEKFSFSTRVFARLGDAGAPGKCRTWIESRAEYYPYQVIINGKKYPSIWDEAPGVRHFLTDHTRGRMFRSSAPWVKVLCKYCYVMSLSLDSMQKPLGQYRDIDDYGDFPYLSGYAVDINCDDLSVVLSRNSVYVNNDFERMAHELSVILKGKLLEDLNTLTSQTTEWERLVLTNQYIFRSRIGDLVMQVINKSYEFDAASVEHVLFEAKLHAIDGKKGMFSLREITEMKTPELPLFFCTKLEGLSWLGRRYKHDFVIMPPKTTAYDKPANFLFKLLDGCFPCMVVDLDTIHNRSDVLKSLVERGIIDPSLMVRDIRVRQKAQVDKEEEAFLTEIQKWIRKPELFQALERNLLFPVNRIDVALFEAFGEEENVLAALFDENGKLLNLAPEEIARRRAMERVYIGLNSASPLFGLLKRSKKNNRSYYILGIIAHELVCTQKIIPHSAKFYYLRNHVERDLVTALKTVLVRERK